ncbi:phytoene desaturase family protein [Anoxybacillus flavithermus]|uniref:phytoene desaturase family protein n=1 Tax=Anoxybacillus flavithermus TaxID=33934 RepID=UPI0002FFC606|nr:phytoene desaturase family protein [Anoxybacillus flavithermus]AST07996.1 phytoene desaturase [Anoxybacillus flavithermus]
MKKIIVIGAGPGGLAAAMLLAARGYDVSVFEKKPYVGGRNGRFELGEYRFDIGPTFLSMPHIIEELFAASGRNIHDYIQLVELDPMYELVFNDVKLAMTMNREEMKKRIATLFPGNEHGYEKFINENERKLQALAPILQSKMDRLYHYLRPSVVKALPQLTLSQTLYDVLSRYFDDERLRLAFTFQAKYLGMSPWECPGAFSILSYMEHAYGIYHVIGGLSEIPKAMARIVEEYGGRVYVNEGVRKLWIDGTTVKGVVLENGETVEADEVIINADFAHAMTNLVDDGVLRKYRKEKLQSKKYSCSTFMMYVGVNKPVDLAHHTIIFADDYKRNVDEITKDKKIPDDPSIYVQNAAVTDRTVAPEGKSALYILAPVPNNTSGIDWEKEKEAFRQNIWDTLAKKLGWGRMESYIECEKIITPSDWENDMFVYEGATFNLGHQLSQMMVFRPHNRFEELRHCWLVGGGTHPGSGLPTIFESARITANGILQADRQPLIPVGPLPKRREL